MRRLGAALVIPVLAILLAAFFSPHAPATAEASQSEAAADSQSAVHAPAIDSVVASLQCLLSGAREVVTDWTAKDSCV